MATNLATGSHATVAALVPAAPILIAHLGGGAGQAVAVQSAWALGVCTVITADMPSSVSCRTSVLMATARWRSATTAAAAHRQRTRRACVSGHVPHAACVAVRTNLLSTAFCPKILRSITACATVQLDSVAGNIAGDGPEARQTLTANGAIWPLAAMVMAAQRSRSRTNDGGSLQAGQIAAWALSNVIKGAGREVSRLPTVYFSRRAVFDRPRRISSVGCMEALNGSEASQVNSCGTLTRRQTQARVKREKLLGGP